jgi:hypothetical protein
MSDSAANAARNSMAEKLRPDATPAQITALREGHQDIIKMYEKMMGPPPSYVNFTPDQLNWIREAWFGAAKISRKALMAR